MKIEFGKICIEILPAIAIGNWYFLENNFKQLQANHFDIMTPRFCIVAIILILSISSSAFAQTKTDVIKTIKKEFQKINRDFGYEKLTLEKEAFLKQMCDGGCELTGYLKNGQIKKIYQWIGLSNGNEIIEFYFKKGNLIFVYEKFNSFLYDQKGERFDRTKTETSFIGRYYFNNNKLIDYITTGHNRFEDDRIDVQKTLLAEANQKMNLLLEKRTKYSSNLLIAEMK